MLSRIYMTAFVYILKDKNSKFYIGSTDNLNRRMRQHLIGHTQTTRIMKDFSLVFSQEYPSLKDARTIEFKLKKLKRKDYIEKIIQGGYIKIGINKLSSFNG